MTDPKLLIFGSFTEDEIKSLQSHPMKNDVEITFGSLDSATLRSVGILNSNLTKVDSSKRFLSPKAFNKDSSINTSNSTGKASMSVSFFQENGSAGVTDLSYHSTAQEVKPCNKAHPLLRFECASISPKKSSIKQDSTENVTNLSTYLDGMALCELSKDFNVGNCRKTPIQAIQASSGPAKMIKYLQPRGLVNLGNLCFLNATLQALLSCVPFVRLLQELRTRDLPETGYPTLRAFVEFISDFDMPLISTLMRKEMIAMETGRPFRPLMFESVLKSFTPDVPKSLTGRPRQEDAQEFLSFIMHQMHDELLKLDDQLPNGVGRNSSLVSSIHVDDDEDNWETVGPRNKTAITRTQSFVPSKLSEIFGGQLKSIVKARGNKPSATVQPFLLLHLNICPDSVCTIEDALRLFSAPEALEGYRSPADGKAEVVNASKSVKILELSDVMVLHLMRFTYGVEGSIKLHKPVHFPLELVFGRDLLASPYSEGRRYELVATITHHGMDPSKGHYTADARHATGKWLRYDDAAVTPIPMSKVLHEQAYILFYKQM